MHGVRDAQGRAHLMRRWVPPNGSPERTLVAIALNLAPALVAVAAFILVAPASDWSDPVLIAALAVVAAVAYGAEARLKSANRVFFGATLVVAVVTLGVAGPLP